MKAVIVIGTRPEAIKLAPVVLGLQRQPGVNVRIISTTQHRELLHAALAEFGIAADRDLDLMQRGQSLPAFASRCLASLDPVLRTEAPDVVIAQGDTTTTFIAALASFYNAIPFAHVEAGLRTGNLRSPFPEEFNRVAAGRLADFHFAPTETARDNLLREGVAADHVVVSGNTVIDALFAMRDRVADSVVARPWPPRRILMTVHRRESFGEPLAQICEAVAQLLVDFPEASVVWPVHPNPAVRDTVERCFTHHPRVRLSEPLGYRDFVTAMLEADLVLTDSGGVQEEAPALGLPVVVLREVTERPEAVEQGGAILAGTDSQLIRTCVGRLLGDEAAYREMARVRLPYGDGQAAGRIVAGLMARYS
jgi:UDP-N-acetylglucosamine 2-epimerase (non-hydrolysing)